MAEKLVRTYKNPTTEQIITSSKQSLGSDQDLANQGYSPVGTETKLAGGTLYASNPDASGQRYERFVQNPVTKADNLNTNNADGGLSSGVGEGTKTGITTGGPISTTTPNVDAVKTADIAEPDKEKIRTEKLADAQAVIDAINQQYNKLVDTERQYGLARSGTTRALNVAGGLAGGDFSTAKQAETDRYNQNIMRTIEEERGSKINAILTGVKNETNADYEAKRKEYIEQAEDKKTAEAEFQKTQKTDAITRMNDLASSDLKLEDLKKSNKDVYDKLLSQSGLSAIEFDSIYNAKSTTPVKYEYKEMKDGTLLRIGSDGKTEEIGDYTTPPDPVKNWKIETMGDGSLYWVIKDSEGNVSDFKKFESSIKKTSVPSQSTITKKALEEDKKTMSQELATVVGEDNFVSPQDYNIAKKAWIEKGYSPLDFDKEFQGFRNPQNTSYLVSGEDAEAEYKKEQAKQTTQKEKEQAKEQEKINTIDEKWGTVLSARKNGGKTRAEIEKELKKKYGGVPDDAINWLNRNF